MNKVKLSLESEYSELKNKTCNNKTIIDDDYNYNIDNDLPLNENESINEKSNINNNLKYLESNFYNEYSVLKERDSNEEPIFYDASNDMILPFSKQVSKMSRNSYCGSNSGIFDLCNYDEYDK